MPLFLGFQAKTKGRINLENTSYEKGFFFVTKTFFSIQREKGGGNMTIYTKEAIKILGLSGSTIGHYVRVLENHKYKFERMNGRVTFSENDLEVMKIMKKVIREKTISQEKAAKIVLEKLLEEKEEEKEMTMKEMAAEIRKISQTLDELKKSVVDMEEIKEILNQLYVNQQKKGFIKKIFGK